MFRRALTNQANSASGDVTTMLKQMIFFLSTTTSMRNLSEFTQLSITSSRTITGQIVEKCGHHMYADQIEARFATLERPSSQDSSLHAGGDFVIAVKS